MTSTISPTNAEIAYGAWPSPLSAAIVAAGASPLTQLAIAGADGNDICWLAGRASEAGRNTLLRQRGARVDELTPAPFNVRTRVHEYGGGAYVVDGETVYFSNFSDNRLYQLHSDGVAQAISTGVSSSTRHADFIVDKARARLITVREQHPQEGHAHPDNTLGAVGFDGSESVLASGHDFYAAPRLSPDGSQLAWLTWDHPRLPWQGTELWLAEVLADGSLGTPRLVAGSAHESICQPEWSPNGVLHFVSDRSGWWNLYRLQGAAIEALCPMEAEFATPHWTFGGSMYGFLSDNEIVCTWITAGVSQLGLLNVTGAKLEAIAHPYQEIRELRVGPGFVVLLGGSPTIALELARIDLSNNELDVLARSIADLPDAAYLSVPRSISYPSVNGRISHAFFTRRTMTMYRRRPARCRR